MTTQTALFDLPDHANEADDRAVAIDRVGIKGLSYPIQVMDRSNTLQHTVAEVDFMVALPAELKGTHMSRFVEILNAVRGEMTLRNIPDILAEVQRRLEADVAYLDVRFPYFVNKTAPVSGASSLMNYACRFRAERKGPTFRFVLGVQVPVKSLCPCSKAVSEYGAHNQRSLVDVELDISEQFVWLEDVIERVEACGSAPLYALLKREDEKFVTEQAYDNPKFVEDLVRDVLLSLRELEGVPEIRVRAENLESIHNHSAFAQVHWRATTGSDQQIPLSLPRAARDDTECFGNWVRQQRTARKMRQQDFAEQLRVSPSYLSRVESGEKMLSPENLDRLAAMLGIDPVKVRLRAGLVPEDILQRIARDPEAFLRWARD